MIAVPSDPQETTDTTAQTSRSKRAQSIDMLKDEHEGYALRSKAPAPAEEVKGTLVRGDATEKLQRLTT